MRHLFLFIDLTKWAPQITLKLWRSRYGHSSCLSYKQATRVWTKYSLAFYGTHQSSAPNYSKPSIYG